MNSQTITMLIPVAIVAFILWVRARNRRLQREHDEALERERIHFEKLEKLFDGKNPRTDVEARIFYEKWYGLSDEELGKKWQEAHKTPEEKEVERAVRRKQLVAEFNARRAARSARSQLIHPEQYTMEEILEAVARGFIPPDDPAVTAFGKYDPELRGDADLAGDLNDPDSDDNLGEDLDDDLRDDFDKDFVDPDLRDDFADDLDDPDFDDDSEGDWDREDAVMRAQSNLRIMREEDQNYALDAIEAEVLNLDHEPDEDELVAIADRAADFYDMSEDYRDY